MIYSNIGLFIYKDFKMTEYKYFTCACFTPDHTMRVTRTNWSGHEEVDFEIFIEQRSFWSRLKSCFRYLFFQKVNSELTTCVCTMSIEKAQELAKYLVEPAAPKESKENV
jgi:hypothetical protein